MHFEFEIVTLPERHEHPYVFTEGPLSVLDGEVCAWRWDDILLIEFALVLRKWLQHVAQGGPDTLHYSSMNYEEEPVLAFVWHPSARRYLIASDGVDAERCEIHHHDLVAACERYLDEFGQALRTSSGLVLGALLDLGEG